MAKIKAELIDCLGDDLRVVNAARVSFDKASEWDLVEESGISFGLDLVEGDKRLISYLAKHGHWTPFAHCMITLRETVPIFVARQRFKHMVGFTYNEVSRRYVDNDPEFYVPEVWRERPDKSLKQGSGDVHKDTNPIDFSYQVYIENCKELYNRMLSDGVAPEMARMVLPQSMMTSYYVTGSLAAFARAYKQRIDFHAQKEIQDLAVQWDNIIRPLFPISWAALIGE